MKEWEFPARVICGPRCIMQSELNGAQGRQQWDFATGNFPSGGCSVPVESTFDFSSSGDAIDVEFSKPNTVLRGPFGGCSFLGNQIFRYHFVKVGSNPNQSWTRNIQGQGCGAWGAGQSVNKQISSLAQQCAQQGGAASSSSRMPSCGPVDPNDLSCPSGICTVSAQFNCAL
jgi:hypothetical protein